MKRLLPVIALFLFVAAEAFLKEFIRILPSVESWWPILFTCCIGVALASAIVLTRFFHAHEWGTWQSFVTPTSKQSWHTAALIVILLAGTFFRLWHLGSLAEGMTYDEAYKGLDGIAVREFHERPVFLDWNGGREALVAYLVAANQAFFDHSIVSVRLITPITGCLTLLFFYLFVEIVFNRNVALLSTFLMAVSKYHIIHSRYGVRAGQFTLYEVAALYFVARALRSEKRFPVSYLIAGFIAGLGFYTYIAYRIFPMILVSFLLQKDILMIVRRHALAIACAVLLCGAIVTPTAIFYAQHLESFTQRMQKTEAWNARGKDDSPLKLVALSTANTAGMFTYKGDKIARHNVFLEPMLSPFASSFFLLGLILAAMNWRKPRAAFVILYLFFGILPGILSVDAPNAPRNLGSIPPAMLLAAFGILAAVRIASNVAPLMGKALLMILLGGNLLTGVNDALFRFPEILDSLPVKTAELWGMDRDPTEVVVLLNQIGPGAEVYVSPEFFFHSTVEYLTYGKSTHRLFGPSTDFHEAASEKKIAMVILQPANANLWWLRNDDQKRFEKWWEQIYGMHAPEISKLCHETYDNYLTNSSDRKWLSKLHRARPDGHILIFDHFALFVFKPYG